MTDVSIIVVSYNTRDVLRDCLAAIEAGCDGVSFETFVVDNASSDCSAEMVGHHFPSVRLLSNERNMGFAAANNVALGHAVGRYILLLNPDTMLAPGAVAQMVRFMDARPSVGYCGPRLLSADGSHQPSARRFPTMLSAAFSMVGMSQRYPRSQHALDLHLLWSDRRNFRADWLTGACLMVRAKCAREVGALDEGFFMYYEETDWCRRMASAGWEGWYVASAEVVHLGGKSVEHAGEARPFSGDHPEHWVRSSRRYIRRHYGLAGMVVSEALQVILYALIWMRHRWRRADQSQRKAGDAAAAIRCLVTFPTETVQPESHRHNAQFTR